LITITLIGCAHSQPTKSTGSLENVFETLFWPLQELKGQSTSTKIAECTLNFHDDHRRWPADSDEFTSYALRKCDPGIVSKYNDLHFVPGKDGGCNIEFKNRDSNHETRITLARQNSPSAFGANLAPSMDLTNANVLEIVALNHTNNQQMIVLSRRDIIDALRQSTGTVSTNDWSNIRFEKADLLRTWLPRDFDTPRNRDLAEANLARRTVRKVYSLDDLGVTNRQQLLKKYFEEGASGTWIKRNTADAKKLRDPDLIATLKARGFEVWRADFPPVLVARDKSVNP
jgi:hypothetical protein